MKEKYIKTGFEEKDDVYIRLILTEKIVNLYKLLCRDTLQSSYEHKCKQSGTVALFYGGL